ncbi:ATP-binding protein [Anabaena sp. UHCC 0204]|uniref:ATP-binding protein n=1 Tax=Anabaena sp. UHCC 0204 TaxID=2590009 RepID=UPI00144762E8|nr:ATP-binding protein [Anabaena sp. UHCC 0204]MTJ08593.1 ATP-binding protein [Anabaena sp. UHCC 0204]
MPELNSNRDKWVRENYFYLRQAIARIEKILNNHHPDREISNFPPLPPSGMSPPSALEQLCQIFHLSDFERDLVLLCVGIELNNSWGSLFVRIQSNAELNYPSFSLAMATLPGSYWGAITPDAPLRQWRIIELSPGKSLTNSPIRLDERILHYLWGIQELDERLISMVEPLPPANQLVPSHQEIADQIKAIWEQALNLSYPALYLCGSEINTKKSIAANACWQLNSQLQIISADTLPLDITQLSFIQSLWEREWTLNKSILFLDCDSIITTDTARENTISRFIETIECPLIISSQDRRRSRQRPLVVFDIHQPSTDEQRLIWKNTLGTASSQLDQHIDILVSHFNLSSSAIQAVGFKAKNLGQEIWENINNSQSEIQDHLWDICRTQARLNLDDMAERIDSTADWDDLILPEKDRQTLQEIAIHVRQRTKVYESWGFASKSKRGLGISALFAGQSGTGKTMAAEVLGNNLKLDVYRIDLSSVVSKYIGETEKNLRRVFDAAEGGGAILLFDEADALFGKRSEVKDSHDRYANMEVSYLLQRMEAYQGLAVLTTNLKGSIDQAFLRRLGFVVQFPFPDATQREEIWKRIFPKKTPTEGLNFKKLSSLNVAGGNIRNIAKNATFLAAEANESVMMKHILQAAKSEYVKLERPMTDNEVRGWI